MAIFTAVVKKASMLKNVLNSLNFLHGKYARLKACNDGFYLDIEIDGIYFTLGLRSDWFVSFQFTDIDCIIWPFSFDFDQFLRCVHAADDSHFLELYVINTNNVVLFQLNVYDSAIKPIEQNYITNVPSECENPVPTFEDINSMFRPKSKLFRADLAIDLLRQSIRDGNNVDVYMTNNVTNMRSKIRHPSLVYDTFLGESCSIECFGNPKATIFTSLKLYEAPYLEGVLTGNAVEEIELIYPPWPGNNMSNLILRLWFARNAFLDFDFSSTCIVRPEMAVYHVEFQ